MGCGWEGLSRNFENIGSLDYDEEDNKHPTIDAVVPDERLQMSSLK